MNTASISAPMVVILISCPEPALCAWQLWGRLPGRLDFCMMTSNFAVLPTAGAVHPGKPFRGAQRPGLRFAMPNLKINAAATLADSSWWNS